MGDESEERKEMASQALWWRRALMLALCAGLAFSVGLPSAVAADDPPAEDTPAAEDPPEDAEPAEDEPNPRNLALINRVEKQLTAMNSRLREMRQEDNELSLAILKARAKALEGIDKPKDITKKLREGKADNDVREYKKILMMCSGELQKMAVQYERLLKEAAGLNRARDSLPEGLQESVDDLLEDIWTRERNALEKAAGYYEDVVEYEKALALYGKIWVSLSEEQQEADKKLKEKILSLQKSIKEANKSAAEKAREEQEKKRKEREKKQEQNRNRNN
jgi:hypothetical protein